MKTTSTSPGGSAIAAIPAVGAPGQSAIPTTTDGTFVVVTLAAHTVPQVVPNGVTGRIIQSRHLFGWPGAFLGWAGEACAGATVGSVVVNCITGTDRLGAVIAAAGSQCFGIGIVNGFKGELAIHNDRCYLIDNNGRAEIQPSDTLTPYAIVADGNDRRRLPQSALDSLAGLDFQGLKTALSARFDNDGQRTVMFDILLDSEWIETRSSPKGIDSTMLPLSGGQAVKSLGRTEGGRWRLVGYLTGQDVPSNVNFRGDLHLHAIRESVVQGRNPGRPVAGGHVTNVQIRYVLGLSYQTGVIEVINT